MGCYQVHNKESAATAAVRDGDDADRDEAGWVCQERWEELRKLGQAGGWLVDHREVPLFWSLWSGMATPPLFARCILLHYPGISASTAIATHACLTAPFQAA